MPYSFRVVVARRTGPGLCCCPTGASAMRWWRWLAGRRRWGEGSRAIKKPPSPFPVSQGLRVAAFARRDAL